MVNVNGWDVKVENVAPRRAVRGWVHQSIVTLPNGTQLGSVCTLTTRKHGGEERERWLRFFDGTTVFNGNLNDLVAGAVLKLEGFKPFAPASEE